ncbi:efflux RND transporter permease subunit [Phormidium tenue]|uniref:Cation transporter n=1 Tax=Phormidium tenue NIES-30 TaxID=549789 RepID=A0A1U7J7J1_9CYAN|nr:CusA/CzcA family heavy metal efflux RND transporter [Phormidium tenue]MBD2231475.1 CusA/CzcA family heavy metal efflux RND transporter [Phormidium tenue FACHB-1052]OKH49135.1 cation transporter [Phormidium tenue NIES-30]
MLEKILRFSIYNRLLVILLTLVAAGIGAYSLTRLPIDAVPDITNNQVQINTVYSSLSPFEIEKQITFPIESSLAGIPGLEYTRSFSRNGFSQVTAVFKDSVDIYFARQQVGERLREASEAMPEGSEPKMGPISTGLGEVYMWAVEFSHPHGNGAALVEEGPGWRQDGSYVTPEGTRLTTELEKIAYLREVQDWVVRPQLKTVLGVAGVDVIGGYQKQYTIEPDPMKLIAYGISFDDIIRAIERNSKSRGAGYVEQRGEAYTVRSSGLLSSEIEIGNVVVGERDGVPIQIRHVAEVGIGKELRSGSASDNGEEVVIGTALMLIGENSRTVAAAVDQKIKEVNRSLPPDVVARPVLNRTKLVDATIRTIEKNLLEGAILVVVVLFLLLGNIRAALITACAIPLSMLLTATGMVQTKISGNLMSLGAIDFGLIVDGAVIIVENCIRRLSEKQHELGRNLTVSERLETVFEASKEVRTATAFGEAIIIVVYLPLLFFSGVEGKMFQPMAITVIFALIAAFILSLTFIPAMVALGLRGSVRERENPLINGARRLYEPLLRASLRLRWLVVGGALVGFLASLLLFAQLGQEFIPTLDEKDLLVQAIRIPSTSLTQSQAMQAELEKTLASFPEVQSVFAKTGTAEVASDPMPPNISDTFVILKPEDEWPNSGSGKDALVQRIREKIELLPGNNYEITQPIQMRFNELIAGVRSDVAVKVFGDEFEPLLITANRIASILRSVDGAEDVKVEQVTGLPVLDIDIDRASASRLGLSVSDVQDVIAAAIGGVEAGTVYRGDRRFQIVVRLPEEVRVDLETLKRLPIPIGSTHAEEASLETESNSERKPGFVPLESVAKIGLVEGPNQISRENGKRRIVVQTNVRGRDMGSFVEEAQRLINDGVKVPAGYWIAWGGQFENLTAAKERLLIVVPLCFALIFILLYSTFRSVIDALIVFSGVPLGLSGGIIALWARGMPFSISAAVGFIALSGVAVLNGLVLLAFIKSLEEKGENIDEAIIGGALARLRPVLMTGLVASLGFVPMAISTGTGAEVQRPIATVVIGGLVSATLLTLLVLPALYRLFHRGKKGREVFFEQRL